MATFGGHALYHLASRLANVIRQGGRQTKNLVLAIFRNPYLSFYNCCIVLCTISRLSNVKAQFNKAYSMLIGCFFWVAILGGAHHFWGDPYLNSTTVLFDYSLKI